MSATSQALLTALSAALPRDTLRVPDSRGNGQELRRYSILSRPVIEYFGGESKPDVFELARNETRDAVNAEAAASVATDRALGALVGLVIGDGVGAPLEFLPTRATPLSDDRPHLRVKPVKGNLEYVGEFNKFGLHRGQWTDDSSMALCLADSLLCRDGYNGSDCRTRYNMWWFQGYNNAFRFDSGSKHSCGLGGNIANSLEEVCAQEGKPSDSVPARFTAKGEDAGNGSIMRLGAVPVRYSTNPAKAIAVAMESSYATHPGPDAAACCAFLAFAVLRAIHRSTEPTTPAAFLDATIAEFMAAPNRGSDSTDTGFAKLAAVLTCKPPTPKEAVWDWKAETIAVAETVRARQPKYNGYPVSPGYFGSYCLDGLAMALWAFRGSTTFSDSIIRITNLLGDCDTTGAIAGQMTGAFYGYRAIPDRHSGEDDLEAPTMGQLFLSNMQRWDPLHEIQLRALLLHKAALAEAAPEAAAAAP